MSDSTKSYSALGGKWGAGQAVGGYFSCLVGLGNYPAQRIVGGLGEGRVGIDDLYLAIQLVVLILRGVAVGIFHRRLVPGGIVGESRRVVEGVGDARKSGRAARNPSMASLTKGAILARLPSTSCCD